MECVAAGETAQQALKTPNSAFLFIVAWLHPNKRAGLCQNMLQNCEVNEKMMNS
jgi:hypothetical protein